ncbi:MAG TPA: MarR family winged helix-turn-helix transcriptional regulator [Terriglobales bacterium]|nr:MarR family winged helix-turn-helix transcriptional regulator [Terriglobales bacterium]
MAPRTQPPAPPAPPGGQPAGGLWFCNWKLWMGAKQLLQEALAPLGLAPREFWLLALVREAPTPQRELAERCGMDPSSLVAVLDGLEARGWVERRRHPRDRRVHLIAPTAAGLALYQQALPLAQRAEAQQLHALGADERRQLMRLLRKLVHA